MVTKSIAPHTLRRIADTSRKFGRKTPTSPIPDIPTILRSLPEHKPLLPLLLSHGIPPKPATMCANRYDSYANELRVETETKLTPYLIHRRKNPPAVVYPLFLSHYTHALRDRAQYILNTALRCLKRESVDLADWVATYPAPLWLPLPQDTRPEFTCKEVEKTCPLSVVSTPPYAFPTTYPPPLRPSCEISSIEWPRPPSTSSGSPSTSTIDIDSLCMRFAKSLVIDENPARSPQSKISIFSPPIVLKEPQTTTSPHTKRSKRKSWQHQTPSSSCSERTPATSPKLIKPRRMSLPPLLVQKILPTSRKASTPVTSRSPRRGTLSTLSNPPCPLPSKATSPHTPSTSVSPSDIPDIASFLGQTIPHSVQLRTDSLPDLATSGPGYSPASSVGPTTPPTLSPELFSEPLVVSSAHTQLTSEPFLAPLADPFTQFQSRGSHLGEFFTSPFECSGSVLGHTMHDFFEKATFFPEQALPSLAAPILPIPFTCDSSAARAAY